MSKTRIAVRDLQFKAVGCYAYATDVVGKRRDKFPPIQDRTGDVAVVTGGARGLGLHTVQFLLQCNFTVVVGVRDPDKAVQAIKPLENSSNVVILKLDLDSLESVKRFSKELLMRYSKVNVLVNNAGILLAKYGLTADGVERNFGVNYLGHFYLTQLVLPALVRAGQAGKPSRVVAVTSTTYLGGTIHYDDINLQLFRSRSEAYAQSKLALIMNSSYLAELARQRDWRVCFLTVDPGIVNTQAFDGTPIKKYLIGARTLLKSPQDGIKSIVHACIDRHWDSASGQFITNCGPGRRSRFSKDRNNQSKLFVLSCEMIHVKPDEFDGSGPPMSVTRL